MQANVLDGTYPVVETATGFGAEVTLVLDEALDESSEPAGEAFTITLDQPSGSAAVSNVAIAGTTVTLSLDQELEANQTVTLGYRVPSSDALSDLAGNRVQAFSAQSVDNETIALPVVAIEAVYPDAAPDLAWPEFRFTVAPAPEADLEVTLEGTDAGRLGGRPGSAST